MYHFQEFFSYAKDKQRAMNQVTPHSNPNQVNIRISISLSLERFLSLALFMGQKNIKKHIQIMMKNIIISIKILI